MIQPLLGQAAVITGAAGAIGAAVARRLSDQGAHCIVADIDGDSCDRLARQVSGTPLPLDVRDSAAVEEAITSAVAATGLGLGILVNAAGVVGARALQRRLERLDEWDRRGRSGQVRLEATVRLTDDEWREVMTVHLDGTFHCTRTALRLMPIGVGGSVVNVASVCGQAGCAGSPHYSAAKGAVIAFSKAVAKDVAADGIRVNVVAPGYIETAMSTAMSPVMLNSVIAATPQGRLGTAEEVADAVAFLCGSGASYITGQVLAPNGGLYV